MESLIARGVAAVNVFCRPIRGVAIIRRALQRTSHLSTLRRIVCRRGQHSMIHANQEKAALADLDSDLAASAPLALRWAQRHCYRNPVTGTSCDWYHGAWQYLRLLGAITTVRTNADFLIDSVAEIAARGEFERVLITGAADYGVLAHVVEAYRRTRVSPQITVLDRCPTPLLLNRWYARRLGINIRTVTASVLDFREDGIFDLICCHSFLGWFDAEERQRLVARWAGLLRSGGVLVTVSRTHPNLPTAYHRYAKSDVEKVAGRLRDGAMARPELGIDADWAARLGHWFGENYRAHVVRLPASITAAFEAADFELVHFSPQEGSARRYDRATNPSDPGSRRYEIIAVRR